MSRRGSALTIALAVGLGLAGPAAAKRYAGSVIDARDGGGSTAKVKTRTAGENLRATIRCKPAKGCPLAKRTKILLATTGAMSYRGTFTLNGATCTMDAYVYPGTFMGFYDCSDGSAGSINGSPGGKGGGGNGDGDHSGGGDYRPPKG